MKPSLSFLIIITLVLVGCRQKARSNFQSESSAQTEAIDPSLKKYAEEAVITGKVLNRDFYPQEKELTLIIPFFRDMENICNDSCTKVRIGIILIYVSQNICPEASGGTSHYNLILLLQFNIQTTEYFINGIQIVFVQIIWKNRSVVACFPVSFCFQ